MRAVPSISSDVSTPASVGAPMSVSIVCGSAHAIHGRRMKSREREDLALHREQQLLLAQLAREVGLAGSHWLWRVRASASACAPSRWWVPRLQAQREAAVAEPAVDERDDAAAGVGDAAHRVDELREVDEVDQQHVVDLDPEERLDGADRERRAAVGVGGVDLRGAVPGDLDDACRAGSTAAGVVRRRCGSASSCPIATGRPGRPPGSLLPGVARRSRGRGSWSARTAGTRRRPGRPSVGASTPVAVIELMMKRMSESATHARERGQGPAQRSQPGRARAQAPAPAPEAPPWWGRRLARRGQRAQVRQPPLRGPGARATASAVRLGSAAGAPALERERRS